MSPPNATPAAPLRTHRVDEADSTMTLARRLLDEGLTDPIAVIARKQTAGYGRNGRRFQSPEGGLWMTLALPLPTAELIAPAGFRAGVAIACVVDQRLRTPRADDASLRIKWPNDILINDRKLCGVLGETHSTHGLDWLLVGIGMNVNNPPEELAAPLRRPATSLSEWIGSPCDMDPLALDISERVRAAVAAPLSRLELEWAASHLWKLDEPVAVLMPGGQRAAAVIKGLTPQGQLVIAMNGDPQPLPAGWELADESAPPFPGHAPL